MAKQMSDLDDGIIWREWFLNKIEKILDVNANSSTTSNIHPTLKNVTVIFGQAGSGKTFLIEMLSQIKRFQDRILLPFYCNFTSTPADFLIQFERQIEQVFNQNAPLPNLGASPLPNANASLLKHLLRLNSFQSKRFLLIIDSIDLRPDICDLISSNLHAFPSWLHVVITARPKRYRGITKVMHTQSHSRNLFPILFFL